jgi:hypothetical protein
MGIVFLFLMVAYWGAAAVLFVVGIVQMISKSSKNEPVKPGLKLLIISIVMLVIGFGACAAILFGMG